VPVGLVTKTEDAVICTSPQHTTLSMHIQHVSAPGFIIRCDHKKYIVISSLALKGKCKLHPIIGHEDPEGE